MSAENEVSAESVVGAIIRGDAPSGEYVLDGKTIKGKFDLSNRVISIPIRVTNCTFEDEVDLGNCEFKQCVDFSVSRFKKKFDSAKAIYQKDIICSQATFEDEVIFNGCICEGTGFFRDAKFENVDKEINFIGAKFGGNLHCIGAVFKGGANFNSIQCEGTGFFRDAKFENVDKEIDFIGAKFGGDLDCDRAVFRGGASFNGIQCDDSGFFRSAQFENAEKDIDFTGARFDGDLSCIGAIFKGGASFNGIQCEHVGFFSDAKFENIEKDINFDHAKFGGILVCNKALFRGGASFNDIQCKFGLFNSAQFENGEKRINLSYINCDSLEFQIAFFAGSFDFTHTRVSKRLILWKTKFNNSVNFNCVDLHTFSLTNPRTKSGSDSLPFNGDVDLRRFSFTIFEGTKEQQRHVVEKQAPDKFSIDPYLQFEKYYNSIGDDSYAKDVYYEGRKKLHEYARSKANPDINWSWGKLILDLLDRWILGYGVKLEGTLMKCLLGFLVIGILVFWSDEAMIPKSISARTPGFIMAIEPDFQKDFDKSVISDNLRQRFKDNSLILSRQAYIYGDIEKSGKEWDIINYPLYDVQYKAKLEKNGIRVYNTTYFMKHLFYRLGYSLNMLLPVVNLRIADEYKFPSNWDGFWSVFRGFYTILHIFAGWVLIPLLISSLAGVLRKR